MHIHHLQHVPFEGLGSIEERLLRQGHQLSATHLYLNQKLPDLEDFEALIVMGGPMGVADVTDYPWLPSEMDLIGRAISSGKKVLGICLGAQLIAAALGARVYRNRCREIGWWPVSAAENVTVSNLLPETFVPFHWHGETFELPEGANLLAYNTTCHNQAFTLGNQVIGLQFHLETTTKSARALIEHGGDDLDGTRFVQTAEQILAETDLFTRSNALMAHLLDRWLNT
jgi:GMP synthase-like glutamine amidotransferase